jgi:hypothetical protein
MAKNFLSRTSVFEWHKELKERQESLQYVERKDSPSTSKMDESKEVIQNVWPKMEIWLCGC